MTTTRDASLLTALGARELVLKVLSRPLAVDLLAAWCEQPRDQLPETVSEVAESCGDLPLALSLAGAGLGEELRALLFDYDWIAAKLAATEVQAVIADYAFAGDDEALRLVQGALRLSAHVLAKDPGQLAGQLIGRLRGVALPEVADLVHGAGPGLARPWLRPETPSLTPPGGPLLRTLQGHTSGVNAVAVLADDRRALSGSSDNTLRLWDLESGETIATFTGDAAINCAAVARDDLYVAGSASGAVHILRLIE